MNLSRFRKSRPGLLQLHQQDLCCTFWVPWWPLVAPGGPWWPLELLFVSPRRFHLSVQ